MGHISATIKIVSVPVVLGAAMVTMDIEPAEAVPLPTCDDPVNCLVFEDFSVYSLALLNTISGSNDFDQTSTPGFLSQNAIVIGTGSNGLKNGDAEIDNPYDTPNNVPHNTATNFESVSIKDPGPTFTGDNQVNPPVNGSTIKNGDVWDATTEALRSEFLPGEDVVFYFNLNESNKGTGLNDGQDMLGWLQVTLTDLDGKLQSQTFTLSGAPGFSGGDLGGGQLPTDPTLDFILPSATDYWAHVHGEICVDPANPGDPFVGFGSCASQPTTPPATAVTVNQNLGADQAAFALFNQQLSDLILDPSSGYEIISVDLRMSRVDNGFEQLFILPTCVGDDLCESKEVPEPSSIAMLTAGLLGFVPLLRRKRKS